MTDISPSGGRGKPRITLRRDYRNGKPLPLRRTPFVVQIGVTPAPDGGFVVEVGGAPSFVVSEFVLRRWPAFRRRIETVLGCRVAAVTQAEWEWTAANPVGTHDARGRGLARGRPRAVRLQFRGVVRISASRGRRHGAAAGGGEARMTTIFCSACGAEADAACECGKPYEPAGERAAEAVTANPGKSDRAIVAEIGVGSNTVRRARAAAAPHAHLKPSPAGTARTTGRQSQGARRVGRDCTVSRWIRIKPPRSTPA